MGRERDKEIEVKGHTLLDFRLDLMHGCRLWRERGCIGFRHHYGMHRSAFAGLVATAGRKV